MKNNNIHFHLILDSFIPFREIQQAWNSIQENNGYLKAYETKTGHKNAPSTHVKSVTSVNNFVDYVIKYATKDENHRPIKGRVWGMSDKLRSVSGMTCDLSQEIWEEIQVMQSKKRVKEFHKDYASVYFIKGGILGSKYMTHTHDLLIEFYKETFVKLYNSEGEIKENESDADEIAFFIDCEFEKVQEELEKQQQVTQLDFFDSDGFGAPASSLFTISMFH